MDRTPHASTPHAAALSPVSAIVRLPVPDAVAAAQPLGTIPIVIELTILIHHAGAPPDAAVPASLPPPVTPDPLPEPLSRRECEILPLIAAGLSNREIGAQLYVSETTVKKHAKHIYRKLSVPNRFQAARHPEAIRLSHALPPIA